MMGETWAPMLLVAGSYLAMFGIGELLRRARLARAEVTRRSNHVGAGVIALALPLLFDSPWPVLALAVPFVAFLLATKLIGWLGSVHGISRRSAGAFLYPVSIAATFVIASDNYPHYAIAVLALALGDPAAGVAGERWKQHSYSAWGQVKTWEGSLAALTVTTALSSSVLVLIGVPPVGACVTGAFIGVVVALIEGALPWGVGQSRDPPRDTCFPERCGVGRVRRPHGAGRRSAVRTGPDCTAAARRSPPWAPHATSGRLRCRVSCSSSVPETPAR